MTVRVRVEASETTSKNVRELLVGRVARLGLLADAVAETWNSSTFRSVGRLYSCRERITATSRF
jgi:hypothetical protein